MIHATENSDDLVVRPLRLKVNLVDHLRPEVVFVLYDGSAALPVAVTAHRVDVAGAGQSQSVCSALRDINYASKKELK